MNFTSILFPTDFSQNNDRALEFAATLAADSKATLHIVHVHEVAEISAMGEGGYAMASQWEEEQKRAEARLAEVKPPVAGLDVKRELLIGSPVTEILSYADRHEIGLIVMGSHGRTGLSRLLMGSIAEGVVRRASCPVLVVKHPVDGRSKSDE